MGEKMYRICLSVPLGLRDGKLYLHETMGKVDGWLETMNYRNYLTGTISEDGMLKLCGKLETFVESVAYTAAGTSQGGKISLTLKTTSGIYSVTGEEVEQA